MKTLTEELAHDILCARRATDVLLIEDDPNDAELSTTELSQWGCVVDHATTGVAGIAKVRDHDYDIAIVDLRLPDMSGLEVAKQIEQIKPIMIVFVCTGIMIDDKVIAEAVKYGFVIFPKPLCMEKLAQLSRTLCAR